MFTTTSSGPRLRVLVVRARDWKEMGSSSVECWGMSSEVCGDPASYCNNRCSVAERKQIN